MRGYGKIPSNFWITTAKKLRGDATAINVALYLYSAPSANMLGLYYLPIDYIALHLGSSLEGAKKGLRRCIEGGFCGYDYENEVVWIHDFVKEDFINPLTPSDKRVKGAQTAYDLLPNCLFLKEFFDKYKSFIGLINPRDNTSPSEAPCKPLRSQKQEQEQEQEQDQEKKLKEKKESWFSEFQAVYPKAWWGSTKRAREKFDEAVTSENDFTEIMTGLKNKLEELRLKKHYGVTVGTFLQHAERYLRDKLYRERTLSDDEVKALAPSPKLVNGQPLISPEQEKIRQQEKQKREAEEAARRKAEEERIDKMYLKHDRWKTDYPEEMGKFLKIPFSSMQRIPVMLEAYKVCAEHDAARGIISND